MTDRAPSRFTTGRVLATAAAVFVPLAILAAKAVAPLFALTAVAVLAIEIARRRALPLTGGPVPYLLAALAAWALITWIWSIAPDETLKTGLSLALTLFGGAVLLGGAARLDERGRRMFETGLIVGGAVGFALIAFELATDAWLSRLLYGLRGRVIFNVGGKHVGVLNPGLAAAALIYWTWALAVWRRYRSKASAVVVALPFLAVMFGNIDAVVAGLVAGAAAFGAAMVLPRVMPWVMAAVIAVGVAVAPAVPALLPNPLRPDANLPWLSMSAAHRIIIWKNTARHIRDNPVAGGGFDTARALYGMEDKVWLRYPLSIAKVPTTTIYEPIPLHPHNGVLQVWLELGAVGAAILLMMLLAVVRAIATQIAAATDRAAALALLTTTLTIASISFGAWQGWWLASILLAAAFAVACTMPPGTPTAQRARSAPSRHEIGGPKGPEPTRYGDWERKGRAIDF